MLTKVKRILALLHRSSAPEKVLYRPWARYGASDIMQANRIQPTGPTMPRFSANLDMLFSELPFRARFSAARMAGFDHVELLFPDDNDLSQTAAELSANNLRLTVIGAATGDRDGGETGIACRPGLEAAFETGIDQALKIAEALDCNMVNVIIGKIDPTVTAITAMQTVVDNLTRACEMARERGKTLLIEPRNTRDNPGYFLTRTDDALRIVELVAASNLKLLLDLYHRQIMEGDLAQALFACRDVLGHIQIGNPPLRSRPDQGEINYTFLFELIDELGYDGHVGCAYNTEGSTRESLAWMTPYRAAKERV
jgi:hydroxypyruvate isomerase